MWWLMSDKEPIYLIPESCTEYFRINRLDLRYTIGVIKYVLI